jgi:hypothetical protein
MKKNLLSVVLLFSFSNLIIAQTIWNGPTMTFTKAGFANPALAANQDRITASTWITRGSTNGIYNIVSEAGYTHTSSPANTEWATGTLADYASLSYSPWETWAGGAPNIPSIVGRAAVLHLIAENIYIGITFTVWGQGGASGGSFSYQRTTAPITTPVKLLNFYAIKKTTAVQLNWKTVTEENTSSFSVERSNDGKQFSSIGTVQAAGSSHSEKAYSFTDANPLPSNFYRLKTNDNNGMFSYSSTVAFKSGKIKNMEFFPVPASTILNVQVNVTNQTILQIVDISGRLRKTKILSGGNNAFNLAIDDLITGIYFLKVGDESRMFIKE